jgi:hypothetical protein
MQRQGKNEVEYIIEKHDNFRDTKCNSPVIAGGGGDGEATIYKYYRQDENK